MKTVSTIETRISNKKDASADDRKVHQTSLTIDWTGCTLEDLRPAAAQTLVINRQGQYRRTKKIPQVDTIMAKDVLTGMGRQSLPMTVDGISTLATSQLKPDEVEALIAKLRSEAKARSDAEKAAADKAAKEAKEAKKSQKPPAQKGDGDTSKGAQA